VQPYFIAREACTVKQWQKAFETKEQATGIVWMGVRFFLQGILFAKPMNNEDLIVWQSISSFCD